MIGMLIGAAVASKVINSVSDTVKETSNAIMKNHRNSMQDMIFVNQSGYDFRHNDYRDVIRSLLGMGFTNVNAIELRKHNQGFFTRNLYGQVESVSINGNDSFEKGESFARGAHVVVSFHVYKDSPHVVIPELEQRYNSQSVYGRQPMGYGYQQPVNINVSIDNGSQRYGAYSQGQGYSQEYGRPQGQFYYNPEERNTCDYCGVLIPNKAGFCPCCGAPQGR